MCKEGCVRLGQEGVAGVVRVGNCLKYLKRRWNRKDRRRNRDSKKGGGGKLGQGVGTFKKGGSGNPSRTMLHLSRFHKLYMLLYVAQVGRCSKCSGRGENVIWGDLAFYGGTC